MKKSKKALSLLACLTLFTLTLTSCNGKDNPTTSSNSSNEEVKLITDVTFEGFKDLSLDRGQAYSYKKDIRVTGKTDTGDISLLSILTAKQDNQTLTSNFITQEVGTFTVTYTIETSKMDGYAFASGLTLTKSIQLTVNEVEVSGEELIKNGDFSSGGDHWGTYTDGSDCTITFTDGYMKCVETTISGNTYSPRINTTYPNTGDEFTLIQGVTYNVSLRLKADAARKVRIQLGTILPSDPYWVSLYDTDNNLLLHDFAVTTEWQLHTWSFTLASQTCEQVHLTLEMGTIDQSPATTIYADDISIRAMADDGVDRIAPNFNGVVDRRIAYVASSDEIVDVMEGITATDNQDGDVTSSIKYEIKDASGNVVPSISKGTAGEYTVTYRVSDAAGNEKTATARIVVTDSQVEGTNYANISKVVSGINGEGSEENCNQAKDSSAWYYWSVTQEWGIGAIVSSTATVSGSTLTVDITNYNGNPNDWCVQMFYSTGELDAGRYEVSLTVNSDKARKIRFAGTDYDLVAGDNQIRFEITNETPSAVKFAVALGTGALTSESSSKLVFSDLKVIYHSI